MAITHNGTSVMIPENQIPSDYTKPVITKIPNPQYTRNLILEVDKVTVQNADPTTTLGNILVNGSVGINAQIVAILTEDFIATEDVTSYAILKGLKTNISDLGATGDILKNIAPKYICDVDLFINSN